MTARWDAAIEQMTARVDGTIAQLGGLEPLPFPHYGDPRTGRWTTSPDGDWTGGHWVGMLWLAAHRTGDARYRRVAERWAERLRTRVDSETVFRGFLFWYGAAQGAALCDSDPAREVAVAGARGLATLFDPTAGAIPLGRSAEEASDVGRTDANVDCVCLIRLMSWAADVTGDATLRDIGVSHARRHIEFCVRDDGSVVQSATFDASTGDVLRRYTHKGSSDDSTWARAQAWGMLGYAIAAATEEQEPVFLATAQRTADWWLAHVPEDRVAYWDFDVAVDPQTPRDTSGTAIAAAALLKLAALVEDERQRSRYRLAAEETVAALIARHLTPAAAADAPPGILTDGCYNQRIGLATSNELIWGSYYLYEALHVLAGHVSPTAV
jgi:unsaturated chondroitin disaccharide hydrolase